MSLSFFKAAPNFRADEEEVDLGANQGIMMPKGMLYRFYATSEDECLVMLRIGTPNFQKQAKQDRVDKDGNPMGGDSKENKTVPTVFKDGVFFAVRRGPHPPSHC